MICQDHQKTQSSRFSRIVSGVKKLPFKEDGKRPLKKPYSSPSLLCQKPSLQATACCPMPSNYLLEKSFFTIGAFAHTCDLSRASHADPSSLDQQIPLSIEFPQYSAFLPFHMVIRWSDVPAYLSSWHSLSHHMCIQKSKLQTPSLCCLSLSKT